MKPFKKTIIFLAVVAIIGGAGFLLPLVLGKTSNCGGNSAALSLCRDETLTLRLAAGDNDNKYDVAQLSAEDRKQLATRSQNGWIPGARIFVRTNINLDLSPKRILVVCDTAYGNIPQPAFWNGYQKHFAYAVGYADGSTGLVVPEQFKQLNLAEFVDASLLATNSDLHVSK